MDGLEQDEFDRQGGAVVDIELAAALGLADIDSVAGPTDSKCRGNESRHRGSPGARDAASSGRASPTADAGPPRRADGTPDR